ncbi:hypothetical protein EZS27_020760 [termite gut metagenome]|uniref:Uncharacterized protein n=1 Tax=termite gut metagenome TaxID=433724 RepID=A0A5J4RBM1_9ZZZZ
MNLCIIKIDTIVFRISVSRDDRLLTHKMTVSENIRMFNL